MTTSGRRSQSVLRRPARSARSPTSPPSPALSRAMTVPRGCRERCSSQPTWPFLPSRRIFIRNLNRAQVGCAAPAEIGLLRLATGVVDLQPLLIFATLHPRHPLGIVQVPLHGLAQTGLEGFLRFPAQLALDLAGVDRVPQIVTWPVGYVGDEFAVGGDRG